MLSIIEMLKNKLMEKEVEKYKEKCSNCRFNRGNPCNMRACHVYRRLERLK